MEFDKRITDISKIMNCFTVKDGKVTYIDIKGIVFIPRFRGNNQ